MSLRAYTLCLSVCVCVFVRLQLPFLLVASYGLFNLGIVVHKVFNFRSFPAEQKNLLEDILRAKRELKGKGCFDDE